MFWLHSPSLGLPRSEFIYPSLASFQESVGPTLTPSGTQHPPAARAQSSWQQPVPVVTGSTWALSRNRNKCPQFPGSQRWPQPVVCHGRLTPGCGMTTESGAPLRTELGGSIAPGSPGRRSEQPASPRPGASPCPEDPLPRGGRGRVHGIPAWREGAEPRWVADSCAPRSAQGSPRTPSLPSRSHCSQLWWVTHDRVVCGCGFCMRCSP